MLQKLRNLLLRLADVVSSDADSLSAVVLSQSTVSLSSRAVNPSVAFGGTGDRKLVCGRPFDPLLSSCSAPRALSPICAYLSGTVQSQYEDGLV